MTYSIPTNKLRDLIAVLQTLDPDIEQRVAEVTVETPDRRFIRLGETTEAEVIKDIRESLDLSCKAITSADLVTYIGDLITHNDNLNETIRRIRKALD